MRIRIKDARVVNVGTRSIEIPASGSTADVIIEVDVPTSHEVEEAVSKFTNNLLDSNVSRKVAFAVADEARDTLAREALMAKVSIEG